jgi:hypothetical protein
MNCDGQDGETNWTGNKLLKEQQQLKKNRKTENVVGCDDVTALTAFWNVERHLLTFSETSVNPCQTAFCHTAGNIAVQQVS